MMEFFVTITIVAKRSILENGRGHVYVYVKETMAATTRQKPSGAERYHIEADITMPYFVRINLMSNSTVFVVDTEQTFRGVSRNPGTLFCYYLKLYLKLSQ